MTFVAKDDADFEIILFFILAEWTSTHSKVSTAHPGVTAESVLPTMQNKPDELSSSIGDLAPEEDALKTEVSNSE